VNSVIRIALSLVAASVAAPIAFAAYLYLTVPGRLDGIQVVLAVAWLVCLLHLILIGAPVFVLLKRRSGLSWASISLAGFLAGAVPLGLIGYPARQEGYSSGATWHGRYVEFYQNGEPTRYAWFSHFESCLLWGTLGVIAAVVLWRVWLALSSFTVSRAGA